MSPYDQHTEAFGPGSNGPFLLAVDTPKGAPETEQQLGALQKAVADTPGIDSVAPASVSEDGEMATIFAIPTTAPQDAKTSALLDRLRGNVIPRATADTPLKVYVGGNTAGFEDVSDKVAGRLPVFIAVVIGLSVLLLVMVFRSSRGSRSSPRSSTCSQSPPLTAWWWRCSRRASARA